MYHQIRLPLHKAIWLKEFAEELGLKAELEHVTVTSYIVTLKGEHEDICACYDLWLEITDYKLLK